MSNNGRYLNLENGKQKLETAIESSTGASDGSKIVKTDSTGRFDVSFLPVGVGPDVKTAEASEDLGAGDYVNFWNDGGTEKVRLADYSNGRDAHGFVKEAVTTGNNATVYFEGPNDDLSGLTPGARQYLDASGGTTETPQTTGIHQFLGIAVDGTSINTDIADCIVL